MKKQVFDVIVVGAGSGLLISSKAAQMGLKVAIIEPGPFGGTCLNRGCIPSKMLIHVADVVEQIVNAKNFGVDAGINKISWKSIVSYVNRTVSKEAREIEAANLSSKNVTVFKKFAKFVAPYTLDVEGQLISAKRIFICAGSRPVTPNIEGLKSVKFMTSDDALRLKSQPKRLIIIGGGYIGCELAHFYGSLGTKVSIIQRSDVLISNEDREISEVFTNVFSRKHNVILNANVKRVFRKGKSICVEVLIKNRRKVVVGDALLIAVGRIPNSDLLQVNRAGIRADKRGFVRVNLLCETNVRGIYAIGDVIGKFLFKHSANLEASVAALNGLENSDVKVDYLAMPHAMFSSPQVAAVGATEEELINQGRKYLVGSYSYYNTAMGFTLKDKDGFVKVLADPKSRRILGCHILGSDASTLIHEVIVAMHSRLTIDDLVSSVHVHPALSEVVQRAFAKLI